MADPTVITAALRRFKELAERERYENSLLEFLQGGWKYIDPQPFKSGWHLEAIAEHLQAVTRGDIKRLIINIPPRSSKSSLCSVAFTAWTWAQSRIAPLSGPQVQFLSCSYAQTLSLRDSVKTRRLIESPWYQERWGDRFALTGDVNTKSRFENTKGGYRLATSVDGTLTGEGGLIIIIDDPHNTKDAESETVRESTLQWWDESMSTRLNDQEIGAFIVVMQRLHHADLTGHILAKEKKDWTHLMLPMEYEKERHCITNVWGRKFWEDPRKEEGELLCPTRFSRAVVDDLARRLGPYAAAGQLQQTPTPRGGGIIKESWWQHWADARYPQCSFILASLDTAFTEKTENDPSALTIWGVFKDENQNPKIIMLYGWCERLDLHSLVEKVIDTCTVDKRKSTARFRFPVDRLIIENKASGISVSQEIHRLTGFGGQFGVELFDPKKYGDKWARAYAVQHLFAEGMIHCPWPRDEHGLPKPEGYKWVQEIIDQITIFPRGTHDDYVDSMTMALRWLRDCGFAARIEEHAVEVAEELAYRPRMQALYPV